METYTPVGVIREELRTVIARRANYHEVADLRGAHYGPLVSIRPGHPDYCECEEDGEVCWSAAASFHDTRFGKKPPFAWAGVSA